MHWWRFIYMIFFFKRELRCALFAVWKHCLDCQADSFPEMYLNWHQFLKKNDLVLDIEFQSSLVKQCSRSETYDKPSFPLSDGSDLLLSELTNIDPAYNTTEPNETIA